MTTALQYLEELQRLHEVESPRQAESLGRRLRAAYGRDPHLPDVLHVLRMTGLSRA